MIRYLMLTYTDCIRIDTTEFSLQKSLIFNKKLLRKWLVNHSAVVDDVVLLVWWYRSQTSSNIGLQLIRQRSFAHNKKLPAILRCREYVSSGGGVKRCLIITGTKWWILAAVLCRPKSNISSSANASPRVITASTCACCIVCNYITDFRNYFCTQCSTYFSTNFSILAKLQPQTWNQ